MNTAHLFLGWAVVVSFLVLAVYGLVARLSKREKVGRPFWGLLLYLENALVLQLIVGIVLLVMGGRRHWLHYVYGAAFPAIVVVTGRLLSMRRETRDYVPIAWAAFVAFGLTTRALMTGLSAE